MSLTWTRKLKKIYKKEETKTNKRQHPLNPVQVKIREVSPEGNESDYGGKDL